jgi:hypothetical protein
MLSLLTACGQQGNATEPAVGIRVGEVRVSHAAVIKTMNDSWPVPELYGGRRSKPPRYEACVEKAQPKPKSRAQLSLARRGCREVYDAHARFALMRAIEQTWSRLAMEERNARVRAEEVEQGVRAQLRKLPSRDAREIAASKRDLKVLAWHIRSQAEANHLARSLRTSLVRLNERLAGRYQSKTRCASRYKALNVPYCDEYLGGSSSP